MANLFFARISIGPCIPMLSYEGLACFFSMKLPCDENEKCRKTTINVNLSEVHCAGETMITGPTQDH